MVHREDPPGGLIVISQPAHAWVSGQFARRWGNAEFGGFTPFEEVCLAAEQHDLGFLDWEKSPTFHAASGRPHQFMNMPTQPHLDLWALGVEYLRAFSRYAALLVSRHVTHLCQNNKLTRDPRDAQATQGFLDQQVAVQAELLGQLRDDADYQEHTAPAVLERNTRLVATWDWLSLMCCMGVDQPVSLKHVPIAAGVTTLEVLPHPHDRSALEVRPWPFAAREVTVQCDGRRIADTFPDEESMRRALQEAPIVCVRAVLKQAGG